MDIVEMDFERILKTHNFIFTSSWSKNPIILFTQGSELHQEQQLAFAQLQTPVKATRADDPWKGRRQVNRFCYRFSNTTTSRASGNEKKISCVPIPLYSKINKNRSIGQSFKTGFYDESVQIVTIFERPPTVKQLYSKFLTADCWEVSQFYYIIKAHNTNHSTLFDKYIKNKRYVWPELCLDILVKSLSKSWSRGMW